MINNKVCPVCGVQFEGEKNQIYCSQECYRIRLDEISEIWDQKNKPKPEPKSKIYKKRCPVCGRRFNSDIKDEKYCSDKCYEKAFEQHEKAQATTYPCNVYRVRKAYLIPDDLCLNCLAPECKFYKN